MFGAPPPLLMDEGAVGRVHQADHGVVDVAVEIHPFDQARLAHGAGEDRRILVRLGRVAGVGRHPHEDQALALAHRIGPHLDAVGLEGLVLDQRRDGGAHPVGAEAPAVIGAFDRLALARFLDQPPGRQRRGAVGADVAHGVDLARARAADQHRLAHDLMALQTGDRHVARQGDEIPGVGDEALAEGGLRRGGRRRLRVGRGR
ncbi:hypothetical protein D3C73_697140 [compost metagenome]